MFSDGKQIGDFTVRLRDSAAADNALGAVQSRPQDRVQLMKPLAQHIAEVAGCPDLPAPR
ncbi:hypothetical protein ACIBG5_13375 [Kribbella sp. NPDC050241]|uniref:hypothetical protein n=1 Tax=Kribbella sp. NPDC050241 TaxID=3364115 RepID=UPI0037940530